ncbi:unnamed protein product [Schistosoma curassoni]|uniref:Exonuclease domain-containing protein n=1 Tax=Schistosoma curassoni TaxID=6186 RepID=A0A183L329_9TREM|nr:unnamed protein product [Schistosoma curassoni]
MQKTVSEAKRIGAFYHFDSFAQNNLTNIEFPVVVLDSVTGTLVDSFQSFVKPTENPELSVFCSDLTSIQQCDIEDAPTLAVVLKRFEHWLRKTKETLGCSFKGQPATTAIFVTWTGEFANIFC